MLSSVHPLQWVLAILGAFGIGVSKTGIMGLGVLCVALYAIAFPSRESLGIILPVLIAADIVAVGVYRRHAVWWHLWRLFPCAAVGIVVGYLTLGHIGNHEASLMIGAILAVLVGLQQWRGRRSSGEIADGAANHLNILLVVLLGVLAGFTTMVANAAGPLMILYLLASGLSKLEFVGTGAWYFLILNLFKVPFSVRLGLITDHTLAMDLVLAPTAILGAFAGRLVLAHIDQKQFERIALVLTGVAAIRLLLT